MTIANLHCLSIYFNHNTLNVFVKIDDKADCGLIKLLPEFHRATPSDKSQGIFTSDGRVNLLESYNGWCHNVL